MPAASSIAAVAAVGGAAASGYSAYSSSQQGAAAAESREEAVELRKEREKEYRDFLGEEHAATKEDIRETAADKRAHARQNMINRGLYNTTALSSALSDIEEGKKEDLEAAQRQYEKAYTKIGGYGGSQGPSRQNQYQAQAIKSLGTMGSYIGKAYNAMSDNQPNQQTQNPYMQNQQPANLTGLAGNSYSGSQANNWAGLGVGQSMNAPQTQGASGVSGPGASQGGLSNYPTYV